MRSQFAMRLLLPILFSAAVSLPAEAASYYQSKDDHGNTIFSDRPGPGTRSMELPAPANSYPAPPIAPSPSENKGTGVAPSPEQEHTAGGANYDRVTITTPSAESSFASPAIPVVVNVTSKPAPLNGHVFRLMLDGKTFAVQKAPPFTMTDLDPGPHTVMVQIIDQNQRPLVSSEAILFYVHRPSILLRPNRQN